MKKLKRFKLPVLVLIFILMLGAGGFYYTVSTSWSDRIVPQWIGSRPIAHRGLHDIKSGAPENSLESFKRAIASNYPIELDVHLTKDKKVVVFHDSNLKRMTGLNKKISECTLSELSIFRLAGTNEKIPALKEVLDLVSGKVPLLIELKNESKSNRSLERETAALLKNYSGDFAVQSFNPFSLKWFRKKMPGVFRGQLAGDFRDKPDLAWYKKFLLENMLLNPISKPDFIAYDHRCIDSFVVDQKIKAGVPIVAWTTKTPAKQKAILKKAHNVIFENYKPAIFNSRSKSAPVISTESADNSKQHSAPRK